MIWMGNAVFIPSKNQKIYICTGVRVRCSICVNTEIVIGGHSIFHTVNISAGYPYNPYTRTPTVRWIICLAKWGVSCDLSTKYSYILGESCNGEQYAPPLHFQELYTGQLRLGFGLGIVGFETQTDITPSGAKPYRFCVFI